jgi:hypothetical protein
MHVSLPRTRTDKEMEALLRSQSTVSKSTLPPSFSHYMLPNQTMRILWIILNSFLARRGCCTSPMTLNAAMTSGPVHDRSVSTVTVQTRAEDEPINEFTLVFKQSRRLRATCPVPGVQLCSSAAPSCVD